MSSPIRAYGGWRERRGFGIGSLNGQQTAFGLAGVLLAIMCVLLMPSALPVVAVPVGVTLGLLVVRVKGESVAGVAGRHARWHAAKRTGRTAYESTQTLALPGVLGDLVVRRDHGYAVLIDERSKTMSVVVPVEPAGLDLVDAEEVRTWVTGWGGWLAHLGYVPHLSHVQVTVHTAPQPPSPSPPMRHAGLAQQVMQDLATDTAARGATRTMVTVTLRANGGVDSASQRVREVLGSMESLNRCGMVVLAPLTEEELIEWVRSCFDPATAQIAAGQWPDARPTVAQEGWDTYRHDGGYSAAFMWDEVPGQSMSAHTLTRLLGPSDYVKRVCMVFEPVPAHEAAREVDRQTQAALFRSQYRRRLGRDETARDRLDVQRAQQTAHEQASGSGLVDVGLYAVVTANDAGDLQLAAADVHNRAGESRVRLRRAYGRQAQYFAVSLGLGYVAERGW